MGERVWDDAARTNTGRWDMGISAAMSAPRLASVPESKGADWQGDRIQQLQDERATLVASRPDLSGKTWARLTGMGVLGLGGAFGAGLAAGTLFERSAYFKSIPAYKNPGFETVGVVMLAMLFVGPALGFGGFQLGSKLTKPDAAEVERRTAAHQADVAPKIAAIDRQIEALKAP